MHINNDNKVNMIKMYKGEEQMMKSVYERLNYEKNEIYKEIKELTSLED
jgi:hypothetical protein